MSTRTPEALTLDELARRLAAREPAALLVPPRILRRVLKHDRGLAVFGLRADRHGHVLGREALLRIAARDELGVGDARGLPARVYLFARPDPRWLAATAPADVLRVYWRRLFHARVRVELERRRAEGLLTDAVLRERVARIGWAAFDEARAVLRQENLLPPDAELPEGYREFAALYLELYHFDRARLGVYFPALPPGDESARLFAADLDVAALLERTRPEGAADPAGWRAAPAEDEEGDDQPPPPAVPAPDEPDATRRRHLLEWSQAAARGGNAVKAAVLAQAAGTVGAAAARAALEALLERLRAALDLPAAELPAWRAALAALLPAAALGPWPPERRLLYDLQKACVDHERPVFALDLAEWVRTGGRRPVKRPLPHRVPVLQVKHLRSAAGRLHAARLADADRHRLRLLLHAALARAEAGLRDRFRPLLTGALDAVGLRPESFAEAVSRDKLVEELLDRVVDRGFLTLGDLRDAVARNRLKLPDLAGAGEFVGGDKLIRANRRLAEDLDGVYRRGEFYLRGLQRFSAVFFGTRPGRFLTLYLLVPLLGAYVTLEGVQHLIEFTADLVPAAEEVEAVVAAPAPESAELAEPPVAPAPPEPSVHLVNRWSLPLAALFLFGLMHWPRFRRAVAVALRGAWRGAVFLGRDLPRRVLALPAVRALLESWPFRLAWRFGLKPALWALAAALAARLARARPDVALSAALAAYLAAAVVLNTRLGRYLEELTTDALAEAWYWLHSDVLPGLFRAVMALFKGMVEEVERLLYTVDEWLRFRAGDSRLSLAFKPVLALAWAAVAYLVRTATALLIEPQVNPIKHFPVVTVSHKLLLPLAFSPRPRTVPSPLASLLLAVAPLSVETANLVVLTVVWGIPGIFGFLVWELKENWRLYRANQSPVLEPALVGHHGETVPRLLRPGFHSGTVPKLYARLRRAEGRRARRHEEALHHAATAVRRFAERDLLAVLAGSRRWAGAPLRVGGVELATNRVRVRLCGDGPAALVLDFEEHAGTLVASLTPADDAAAPGDEPAAALADALAGFYKGAGADVVREAVAAALPPDIAFALTDRGLLVWAALGPGHEAVYDLAERPALVPRPARPGLPVLEPERVLFRLTPVGWDAWVRTWELDRAGKPTSPLVPQLWAPLG